MVSANRDPVEGGLWVVRGPKEERGRTTEPLSITSVLIEDEIHSGLILSFRRSHCRPLHKVSVYIYCKNLIGDET